MKIHLQTIETSFPETFYFQAEEMLELENYDGLQQIDKHVWIGNLKDQGIWEVEVELNGNFLKEASCECSTFTRRTYCPHVVALLILVRKKKEKLRLARKAAAEQAAIKVAKPYYEKFTVTSIIDELGEAELKKFLKLYARQHKDFALALKTRFAGQVGTEIGPAKYLHILEECRRSNRRVGKTFPIQGQRNYLLVANELVQQLDAAIMQVDFPQSVALLISLLTELPANLSFVHKSKKPLLKPIYKVFEALHELLEYPLAPALAEKLWEFFIQQLIAQGPGSKYTQGPFLDALLVLAKDQYQKEELLKVVLQLLEDCGKETQRYEQLETTRIDLMVRLGKDPFQDYHFTTKHPLLILKILENLEQRKDYKSLAQTLDHALKLNLEDEIAAQVEDYWLRYAKATHQQKLVLEVSELRLINSLDAKYIEDIKMVAPDWETYLVQLIKKLEALPYSVAKRDLIAKILREEEMPLPLFNYIIASGSLEIFNKYAEWLFQYVPELIAKDYSVTIKQYAQEHIGPIAADKIELALQKVEKILGKTEAKELKTFLMTHYGQRSTLMRALQSSKS